MNAIQALKKAHQARAITKDTYSMKEFVAKNLNKIVDGRARMPGVVAMECKHVPKYDKRDLTEGEGAGSLGFRTRFILANGETVGCFANAAYHFFSFFARDVMGMQLDDREPFTRIDVQGQIVVDVWEEQLDSDRTTWNFELEEEGSEVQGFGNYLPDLSKVLQLQDGSFVDTESGEINDAPDLTQQAEATTTAAGKKK